VKLLNIGCGASYHPAWVNIDVQPAAPGILRHDAAKPLPFPDGSFDACYSSHVLEHLRLEDAPLFLTETRRVLKPGGVLRVVVPDLEGIARAYLGALQDALASAEGAEQRYRWMSLELLDQLVRNASGGRMGPCLEKAPAEVRDFIAARIGKEAERFWEAKPSAGMLQKFAELPPGGISDRLRYLLVCGSARLLGGKRGLRAAREGWFRTSGEAHLWMYDRFSLKRLLEEAAFQEVAVCAPELSRIPGFACYGLDSVDGVVRKPDSLFMEGVSP